MSVWETHKIHSEVRLLEILFVSKIIYWEVLQLKFTWNSFELVISQVEMAQVDRLAEQAGRQVGQQVASDIQSTMILITKICT